MELFGDAGVFGKNPSLVGGVWAWCKIVGGEMVESDGHILTPEEVGLPEVTNNVGELYAAVRALESCGPGHHVTLWTDSVITLRRVQNPTGATFNGVPEWLELRTIAAVQRLGSVKVMLCAGHPTREELKTGIKRKNGLPVSRWNVWCDDKCNELKDVHGPELRKAAAKLHMDNAANALNVAKVCYELESGEVE